MLIALPNQPLTKKVRKMARTTSRASLSSLSPTSFECLRRPSGVHSVNSICATSSVLTPNTDGDNLRLDSHFREEQFRSALRCSADHSLVMSARVTVSTKRSVTQILKREQVQYINIVWDLSPFPNLFMQSRSSLDLH